MSDIFYLPEHLLFLKESIEKMDDNNDLQYYYEKHKKPINRVIMKVLMN